MRRFFGYPLRSTGSLAASAVTSCARTCAAHGQTVGYAFAAAGCANGCWPLTVSRVVRMMVNALRTLSPARPSSDPAPLSDPYRRGAQRPLPAATAASPRPCWRAITLKALRRAWPRRLICLYSTGCLLQRAGIQRRPQLPRIPNTLCWAAISTVCSSNRRSQFCAISSFRKTDQRAFANGAGATIQTIDGQYRHRRSHDQRLDHDPPSSTPV